MSQPQTPPSDRKHGTVTPPPPPGSSARTEGAAPTTRTNGTPEEKTRISRKVYICTGDVREFKNAAEAEKFLNTDPNAPKEFAVIKGTKIEKKQKVSLR